KISPHRGHAVDDLEILPAERDDARPGALFARPLPRPVLALPEDAADRPAALGALHFAPERGHLGPQAGDLPEPRRTKRPSCQEQANRFEEVTFALGVGPGDDVQPRGGPIG